MMSHAAMVDEMPMQMNMTGGMVLTSKWQGIPIVFAGWLPTPAGITVSGSGAHIGSCIAIITVGIVFRLLAAWRARCERTWRRAALREFQERLPLEKQGVAASLYKEMPHPRFKLQVDVPRTLFAFVSAVFQYFMMLIVMSMVTSYFFSVCLGLALGELFFGRTILHYV